MTFAHASHGVEDSGAAFSRGAEDGRAPFRAAELRRLVESGALGDLRVELIAGRLVKMSPQFYPHASVKDALHLMLAHAAAESSNDLAVNTEVSVAFSDLFQPLPDLVLWRVAGEPPPDGPLSGSSAMLVIEVADSSLSVDLGEKLQAYASAGVAEYWVVDVRGKRILLHAEPSGDTYARREPRDFGERFKALTLPLEIDTAALAAKG